LTIGFAALAGHVSGSRALSAELLDEIVGCANGMPLFLEETFGERLHHLVEFLAHVLDAEARDRLVVNGMA